MVTSPSTSHRPPALRLATAAGLVSLLLGGAVSCTDSDEPAQAAEPSPTSSAVAPSAEPAALGLEAHVLDRGDLPGFAAQGRPVVQDLEAFAREHDKTVAELRGTGMVAGSSVMFDPAAGEGFAMSVAARFADEGQARTEAARLFAANAEPEDGTTAAPLAVPGVPGAEAVTLTARHAGTSFTGVEIVFSEGVVTHELFAFGEESRFDPQDAVSAAIALYERVAGHPLAP
jgi:hypothetical protein